MDETSARLALPLLAAGQAQKETTHNEALALIDLALHPAVRGVALDVPPAAPTAGQAWIVGAAPQGDWSGRAQTIAGWTAGGWRFVAPVEGMAAWSIGDGAPVRFVSGVWSVRPPAPAIADPAGGATADGPARAAVTAILAALRDHGVIAR